jgi:hypothetical protein
MDLSSGTPLTKIERSNHEMFISQAALSRHKAWLMGMTSPFMEKKDALKTVTVACRDGGSWIKPPEI